MDSSESELHSLDSDDTVIRKVDHMERKAGRLRRGRSTSQPRREHLPTLKERTERIREAREAALSDLSRMKRYPRLPTTRPRPDEGSVTPSERLGYFGERTKRLPFFSDTPDLFGPHPSAFAQEPPQPGPQFTDNEIFLFLKGSDQLFHGCLTDFQLSSKELEGLVKDDPGISEPFTDGCRVAAGQQALQIALGALQMAAHYQIAAIKESATGSGLGQFQTMRAMQLLLHGLSRVHVALIGETAEATEERKARAALRQFVPRDVIPWLEDQSFFRPGAGSGGLPGGTPVTTPGLPPGTPTESDTTGATSATPESRRPEPPATGTPTITQSAPHPTPQPVPQPAPQQIPIQILLQPPGPQTQAPLTIATATAPGFPLTLPTQQRDTSLFATPRKRSPGQRSSTFASQHYPTTRPWTSNRPPSRSPGARPAWPPRSGPPRGRTGDRDDTTRSGSVGRSGRY
jgi:hypothetical protein